MFAILAWVGLFMGCVGAAVFAGNRFRQAMRATSALLLTDDERLELTLAPGGLARRDRDALVTLDLSVRRQLDPIAERWRRVMWLAWGGAVLVMLGPAVLQSLLNFL